MNWKEHAHLFANGKFKIKINHNMIKTLVGIDISNESVLIGVNAIGEDEDLQVYPYLRNCTLMARKIDSLSDEEKMGVVDKKSLPFCEMRLSQWARGISEPKFSQALNMISIGVYPFDQSHFDTGEVIDIKTLTEQ